MMKMKNPARVMMKTINKGTTSRIKMNLCLEIGTLLIATHLIQPTAVVVLFLWQIISVTVFYPFSLLMEILSLSLWRYFPLLLLIT